jgi:hypothetical protein
VSAATLGFNFLTLEALNQLPISGAGKMLLERVQGCRVAVKQLEFSILRQT